MTAGSLMTGETVPAVTPPHVRCELDGILGWRRCETQGLTLWLKGYLNGDSAKDLARRLAALPCEDWAQAAAGLDGHFSLVAARGDEALAAVDRISSIPLSYGFDGTAWRVDGNARRLAAGLGATTINPGAALALAMSGATIGRATLFNGIETLGAGEAVLFAPGQEPRRQRLSLYMPEPDEAVSADDPALRRRLADVTMAIFEKMVASLEGRAVAVPLSAGLDSRLVACAMKELGVENVTCFSYGRRGNFEAEGARRVAAKLGYEWIFVEHTPRQQAATFASEECRAFEAFADPLNAIPFHQDFFAVGRLKEKEKIPQEAVIVNGQTGDYIAGNHIPPSLCAVPGDSPGDLSEEARWARITDALMDKHYDLWKTLRTPQNAARISRMLRGEMETEGGGLGAPENDFALYEMSEFLNRQVKYVVAGQRSYEWHGYDWRLPLWDNNFLDFWKAAPLAAKAGRRLFQETFAACNWGGVWGGEWEFPQTVTPAWLRPVRFAAKLMHAPLGRARWRRFEKNYFGWAMDEVCNYAVAPYGRVARDRRGHRNAVSWHGERYLAAKGLGLDGLPLGGAA
ncbi:MAG: asparagine synthase C-terminal domain-containing protein [Alphaproteobacteria bacterium]|nr:asparagine synthase C-terminal domain-containing protein [Alphaproteobacteria bacterium]